MGSHTRALCLLQPSRPMCFSQIPQGFPELGVYRWKILLKWMESTPILGGHDVHLYIYICISLCKWSFQFLLDCWVWPRTTATFLVIKSARCANRQTQHHWNLWATKRASARAVNIEMFLYLLRCWSTFEINLGLPEDGVPQTFTVSPIFRHAQKTIWVEWLLSSP